MTSVFTKIIQKKIPAYIIAENEHYIAFLDVNPIALGHTLVVPKKQIDYLFDLDDTTFTGLHLFAKNIALALHKTVKCLRIGMAVVGLEVPHAHIHLVPLHSAYDIDFKKERLCLQPAVFKRLLRDIQHYLSS